MADDGDLPLSADERAAMRAFLQRSEVRLSTFHRVALSLLSGAGLLVVLPVVAKDAVAGVLRSLVIGDIGAADLILLVAVTAMLAVPATALWMLFAELTRFFFYANHVGRAGSEVFTPRFTLTSLQLPNDELGVGALAGLDAHRRSDRIVELLVPGNEVSRRRIDRQLQVLGGAQAADDAARSAGLFELAAATGRSLAEEVAKVEFGMTRHVMRLRGLVLRYVKALLALLTTAVAVYACDGVIADLAPGADLRPSGSLWIAAIVLVWAPLASLAIASPIRWIEVQLRRSDAPTTAISDDPDLTTVEQVTTRLAALGWIAAAAAMAVVVFDESVTGAGVIGGLSVLGLSAVGIVWMTVVDLRRTGPGAVRPLLGR